MTPSALVLLSKGTEEIEVVTIADVLRRAGVSVTVAGIQDSKVVECANGVLIKPDIALNVVADKLYDAVIIPGGLGGSEAMANCSLVGKILKTHENAKKYIGAICAAPICLQSHGICFGKQVTSYPGFVGKLQGYCYSEERVVVDDNLVTSRGPGTAFAFAIKLVELLVNKEKAITLIQTLLLSS